MVQAQNLATVSLVTSAKGMYTHLYMYADTCYITTPTKDYHYNDHIFASVESGYSSLPEVQVYNTSIFCMPWNTPQFFNRGMCPSYSMKPVKFRYFDVFLYVCTVLTILLLLKLLTDHDTIQIHVLNKEMKDLRHATQAVSYIVLLHSTRTYIKTLTPYSSAQFRCRVR